MKSKSFICAETEASRRSNTVEWVDSTTVQRGELLLVQFYRKSPVCINGSQRTGAFKVEFLEPSAVSSQASGQSESVLYENLKVKTSLQSFDAIDYLF